jgi:hypothetical protein
VWDRHFGGAIAGSLCSSNQFENTGDSPCEVSFRLFAAAVVLAASTIPACADTFTYDFNSTAGVPAFGVPASFTYTSPDLITTFTPITPITTCSINGFACLLVVFDPANLDLQIVAVPNVDNFKFSEYSGFDLFSVGIHQFPNITMTVTDNPVPPIPPVAPTPEPSILVLLGTGVLGAIGASRRKLFRT